MSAKPEPFWIARIAAGQPARLRNPGESAEDYRIAMGWDKPKQERRFRLDIDESAIYEGERRVLHLDTDGGGNDNWRSATALGARIVELLNAAPPEPSLHAELIRVARLIEDLKRDCGMDPESPQAIRNGKYQSIALIVRGLAAASVDPDAWRCLKHGECFGGKCIHVEAA